MMPDPDAAPERPESVPAPDALSAAEQRAVDAAVAGVAGLLVGRALFGRAGGLVAGLAAVGAGLLAKRRPELKKQEPDTPPSNGSAPVTQVRLEADNWAVLVNGAKPSAVVPPPPEDAGAFAEMPALFGNSGPAAEAPPVPAPDVFPAAAVTNKTEPVVFDDGPAPVEVNILPVADLVSLADEALEKEVFPEEHAVPGRPKSTPVPAAQIFGLLENFPAEFSAYKGEEEPGPREEFLLIPASSVPTPAEPVPPIQSVVAALSESLEAAAAPPLEKAAGDEEIAEVVDEPAKEEVPAVSTGPVPTIATAVVPIPPLPFPTPAGSVSAVSQIPLLTTVPVPLPAPRVATVPIRPVPLVATVPILPPTPPAPAGPAQDPEEIWRQAAAELSALRQAPGKAVPSSPVLPEGLLPGTPAFPVLPTAPVLPTVPVVPASLPEATDLDVPPWLKPPGGEKPAAEGAGHDPAGHSSFLPTIKLSDPQGPQPPVARRPIPVPPENEPAPAPVAAPVPLPGNRAEQVPSVPPAPAVAEPVSNKSDSQAVLASLPPPPAAFAITGEEPPLSILDETPRIATAAMGPPPAFGGAAQLSAAGGEENVFVPRAHSRHHKPATRRRVITGTRVVLVLAVAAVALGLTYKPQLKKLWEQQILGRPTERAREHPLPKTPEPKPAPDDDGTGVRVVPDKIPPPDSTSPATPAAPEATPAPDAPPPAEPKAAPESAPLPPAPEAPGVPSNTASPPTSVAVTTTPSPEPAAPVPATETGARELIDRLIRASTPAGVKPYILDAERLAPALESYFSSGKAVPITTFESLLERIDKSTATGRTVWLFRVTTDKVPRGFPLAVEDTPNGLRADWELLTQCRDGLLQAFLADASAPPGSYCATLKRTHIFPDMLPGKDHTQYFAFEISSPSLGDKPANAFIPRATPLAARADELYRFSTSYSPVLGLAHNDGHVEITGIVRENWRVTARSGDR